jgi:putative endonuclease
MLNQFNNHDTSNIEKRILMHKSGFGSVFTKKYMLTDLLYYERISGIQNAIDRAIEELA